MIGEALCGVAAGAVVQRVENAEMGNAAMNDMRQVWEHAQLAARKRWSEVDTPTGKIKAMRPPGMPDSFNARMDPIPAVGEHTTAILAQIGYSESEIERLRAAQVI